MAIAFFDLDHTLLSGDSDQLWGDFLRERGEVDHQFQTHKNAFFAAYQRGELDIHAFHRFMLNTVHGKTLDELQGTLQLFAQQKIAAVLRRDGLHCIEQHRRRGDQCVIITATNRVIASAAAQLMPQCILIASEPELINDRITGELTGIPSFREGKVQRAHEFCAAQQQTLSECYFYSDSHNDLPLLRAVRYPHVVTPDAILRREAEQQSWPILMWQ